MSRENPIVIEDYKYSFPRPLLLTLVDGPVGTYFETTFRDNNNDTDSVDSVHVSSDGDSSSDYLDDSAADDLSSEDSISVVSEHSAVVEVVHAVTNSNRRDQGKGIMMEMFLQNAERWIDNLPNLSSSSSSSAKNEEEDEVELLDSFVFNDLDVFEHEDGICTPPYPPPPNTPNTPPWAPVQERKRKFCK